MYFLKSRHLSRCLPVILAAGLIIPRLHGDESDTESFDFSREDIAPNLILITYQVRGEKKKGNGVIARMDGKPYLLTNLHILLGAKKITFMTAEGKQLAPRSVELANSRDLVRLSLEDEVGLTVSSRTKMNTPIAVYSGGDGSEKKIEHGKVIGIGSSKIEISATFDDSCNGAPALNAEKEVVGIATYSREFRKHAMKSGTRFEESRHFCSRMGKNDWKPVNWKAFNGKYGKAYRTHEALCLRIIDIFSSEQNYTATQKQAKSLAAECRTQARQLRLLCEQQGLTDFLRMDFEERAELLEYASELFGSYAKSRH